MQNQNFTLMEQVDNKIGLNRVQTAEKRARHMAVMATKDGLQMKRWGKAIVVIWEYLQASSVT